MPNPNGGLYMAFCIVPGDAIAIGEGMMCSTCMMYYSCNATESYVHKLSFEETKAACDASSSTFVESIVEDYPSAASDIANLGWRAGQEYAFDESQGHGKEVLYDLAMIGYRRCLEHGICEPCPANKVWEVVGLKKENGDSWTLLFTVMYSACPNGGKSDAVNIDDNHGMQSCYITGTFSDDTGQGEYTDKCHLTAD